MTKPIKPLPGDVGVLQDAITELDDTSIEEQIITKYGLEYKKDITDIYLYRFPIPGNKIKKDIVTKFDELPDLGDIQKTYGGGEYMLWINFRNDANKKQIEKIFFSIEGKHIEPVYDNAKLPEPEKRPDALDELIKLKKAERELNGNPAPGSNGISAESQLIIENFKSTTQMMMEMIKQNKPVSSGMDLNTFVTVILPMLMKKGDMFEDMKGMLELMELLKTEGSERSEMFGMIKDLIKEGKPILEAIMMARETQAGNPQMQLVSAPGPAALPQNAHRNVLTAPPPGQGDSMAPVVNTPAPPADGALTELLNEVSGMRAEISRLQDIVDKNNGDSDSYDLVNMSIDQMAVESVKILQEVIEDEQGTITEENIDQVLNTKIEDYEMELFKKLGELAQLAPEQKRLEVMALFINTYPEFIVKSFCIKYGLVKDAAEYDSLKAKLVPVQQSNVIETGPQGS